MLTVNVRFVATELTPGLTSGEYSIDNGATVLELLHKCGEECGAPIPEKNYKNIYPLFNGRPIRLESVITENGTLHVSRVVIGG